MSLKIKPFAADSVLIFWRDQYLAEKRLRLSPKTIHNYAKTIDLFIGHVGPTRWPPNRLDVLHFLADVERRSSRITAYSYFAILRAWFGYLNRLGAFGDRPDPAAEIVRLRLAPRKPGLAPRDIPPETVAELLTFLRDQDTLTGSRDLALVHFLYRTGARSGEAASLTCDHLLLASHSAFIPAADTKDAEDRTLFFGSRVRSDLAAWLYELALADYTAPWVFPATRGQKPQPRPLTPDSIRRMFQRRLKQADLPPYRVHDLRHAFTKEAIRSGRSLASIQRQLGHSSPEMVLRYARVFSSDQEKEFIDFGD